MNDDNKDLTSKPGGAPNDADENPWDEDDGGGRTLATDGPSFELPSNIPSPITVPPPPVLKAPGAPGPRPRSPTMMGFGPMGPPLPVVAPAVPARPLGPIAPIAPPAKPAGVPPSSRGAPAAPRVPAAAPRPLAPPPAPIASSDPPPAAKVAPLPWEEHDSDREDGPTMAGAPLTPDTPLRDDVVNPRLGHDVLARRPQSPLASTGYEDSVGSGPAPSARLDDDDGDIEPIGGAVGSEETTRTVSREELLGHQNAQVVFGADNDAQGDEATLAVAPGALADLGIGPGMAAALAEREARENAPQRPPSSPAFPATPPRFPSQGGPIAPFSQGEGQVPQFPPQSQPQPPVQSWQGEASPSYRNPPAPPIGGMMGMPQGYDPLLPQGQGYQSSPGMPSAPQQQGYPMQGGGPAPYAHNPNGQQMPPSSMSGQQWMQASTQAAMQAAAPPTGGGFASKFTPQVILLIVVGAVCVSIFVIGIVLFATTNFQPRP